MTYPKYYKTSVHHIKAINAQSELWVTGTRIEQHDWHDIDHLSELKAVGCIESEFKAAFNKTNKYLKSLI